MSAEVSHNAVKQNCVRHYYVKNPKLIEIRLERFTETKLPRGYRLRYVADKETGRLELSDRQEINVIMAERVLREAGFFIKRIPWTNFFQKPIEEFAWR